MRDARRAPDVCAVEWMEAELFSERWSAISARIKGISDSADVLAQFLLIHSGDSYGVQRAIGNECAKALESLVEFARRFEAVLPTTVHQRIVEFSEARLPLFEGAKQDGDKARAAVVLLSALRSELSFMLSDEQELIRSKTERAFLHLQRMLVANSRERDIWMGAFNSGGEVACEKLGAVHLLWHGIFAFKVDGAGARTDLISPEPPDLNQAARVADGMVLTEWKLANAGSANAKFKEARNQVQLYRGVLAGIELARYRYIIAISEEVLPRAAIPGDLESGGVIYKHINIALKPPTPSVQARRIDGARTHE